MHEPFVVLSVTPSAVLVLAIVAAQLLILVLAKRYGARREWQDLREDVRSLQTRLRATDQRCDSMYEEIETLEARIRAMQDILVRLTDQLSRTRRVEVSARFSDPPVEDLLPAPDLKPSGRTVYDHLMADDDPDVS